jgi:transcription initiation factor TFIIIB Brf1 subunit/transcription initiation factor TFIIB
MTKFVECPNCGEDIQYDPEDVEGQVVCDSCGEVVDVSDLNAEESDESRRNRDIDDLIELDMMSDGDLDGEF